MAKSNSTAALRTSPRKLPPLSVEQADKIEDLLYDLEAIFASMSGLAPLIEDPDAEDEIKPSVVFSALGEKGKNAVVDALSILGEANILFSTRRAHHG